MLADFDSINVLPLLTRCQIAVADVPSADRTTWGTVAVPALVRSCTELHVGVSPVIDAVAALMYDVPLISSCQTATTTDPSDEPASLTFDELPGAEMDACDPHPMVVACAA